MVNEVVAERPRRRWPILIAVIVSVLVIGGGVAAAWAVHQVAYLRYIASSLMEPTLPQGSRVLVASPDEGGSRTGDIIFFRSPGEPDVEVAKRVVAVGPATVTFVNGRVVVDGTPLQEPYLAPGTTTTPAPPALGPQCTTEDPCKVGEGELWVLGDNRANSEDSRFYGPIRRDDVTGVMVRRLG